MADKKISELTALTGADTANDDQLVIVDTSAGLTKNITMSEFKNALDTATGFVRITGDTMTGNLSMGDNVKAIFGAGSDLQIYAASGVSFIKESGAGNLNVNAANFILNNADDSQNMFKAKAGAEVELYYNNAQKLETTATGIDVTGTVTADGLNVEIVDNDAGPVTIQQGGNSYFKIVTTNSSESVQLGNSTTNPDILLGSGNVGIGTSSPSDLLELSGSTAQPAIRLTDSDVSGLYHRIFTPSNTGLAISADTGNVAADSFIRLDVDGTEAMRITAAGNVGIGTSSPTAYGNSQATLVIEDDGNPAIALSDTGQTRDWFIIAFGDGLGIRYADGGGSGSASNITESAFFKNNGNVGIGTSSPSQTLHVSSSSSIVGLLESTGSSAARLYFDNTGMTTAGDTQVWAQSNDLAFNTSGSEAMRIDSSGRLLLGNTDGSYASANADNIVMGDRTSSAESGITFGSTLGSSLRFADAGAVGQGIIQYVHDDTVNTDYMNFYTAATERMRIDSSGRVGIGTSSPSRQLHLSGSGANTRLRVENTTGSNVLDVYAEDGGNSTLNYTSVLTMSQSGTERMRIDSSGNVLVGKSVTTQNTAGTQISASSGVRATVDGNVATILNRTTSDGDIALFRKDGTTVGIVASRGGVATNLILRTATGQGAGIGGANSGVLPCDEDGLQDDEINLGASGTRWNDLYLSGRLTNDGTGGVAVDSGGDVEIIQEGTGRLKAVGGVFIGGAAAGNHLDDYEEGVYIVTLTPQTSGSITLNASYDTLQYIKVGNLVTVTGRIRVSSVSSPSGTVHMSLPFTAATLSEDQGRIFGQLVITDMPKAANAYTFHPTIQGSNFIQLGDVSATTYDLNLGSSFSGNEMLAVSIQYRTA
jgi:hypothetical protein